MSVLVSLNGVISPAHEAKVSVMDRGFLFGDGVYESGRSYEQCFLFLEEHWARLRVSAEKLRLEIPWEDEALSEGLFELARAYPETDMCFRTVVTRGIADGPGLHLTETSGPTLVHFASPVYHSHEQTRKTGAVILTSSILRNASAAQDPNIKTSNYLNSLLACQDVQPRGTHDAIMCDAKGNVTEGTNFSLFGVTLAGTVVTPSLDVGILDSITRRHLLRIARELKIPVEEGTISLRRFQECREVFMASSNREVMPVCQWDDYRYSVPGEVTQLLHERFMQSVTKYIENNPKYL